MPSGKWRNDWRCGMSRRKRKGTLLHSPFLRRRAHSSRTTAITPLPAVIHKGGFELTIVKGVDRAAIYRQHFPGDNPNHDAYDVILPQVRDTNYEGQPVAPYEGYPAAESWGKKGWTFTALASAVQKFKQLAKASRRGTVSRKNGLGRDGSSEGRLVTRSSRIGACENNVASPLRQSRQTPLQRNIGLLPAHIPCLETTNTQSR